MSIIFGLTAALIFALIGLKTSKRTQPVRTPVIVQRYLHTGHTWARIDDDGNMVIGVDDFAQSLIGTIEDVQLPRLLHRVRKGDVAFHVWHGDRRVPLVAPVGGWVVEKNEMLQMDPGLVNSAPYNDGWLIKVRPFKRPNQLPELLTGRNAMNWQDAERSRLGSFFSGTPALMYQDGGVMLKNLSDRCSDDEWNHIVEGFFLPKTGMKH